ncbi:MAG: cell division protein ZipA C-terminal FtsZ-binding domain-containing protein [Steroidobacteraceae bacterium]
MSELRWILLGAGVALILALWWWETRKAQAKSASKADKPWPRERAEPTMNVRTDPEPGELADSTVTYAPVIERVRVARRPPLIEIPEDFEVDVSDFVSRDRRRAAEPELSLEPPAALEPEVADAANESEAEPFDEHPDEYHRAPWVSTHPLERDQVAPRRDEEPPEPAPADAIERRTAEASKQRIVALRLIAPGGPWGGGELRKALEAEGLRYGPYSIYHREREDGKTLLYVASMMEPGSFDLAKMDSQHFPGISLFGIVPGPLDAPSTFDLLLTVGRSLAERMKGQLQDEQGSTLTAQRILNLREELVHFEHRNRRLHRI